MELFIISFIAGVLTILAPCVIPLLPVIIGGSVMDGKKSRPGIILLSFAISTFIFAVLLKTFIAEIAYFEHIINYISGGILTVLGIFLLFPNLWWKIMHLTGIEKFTSQASYKYSSGESVKDDIILGVVLGPLFTSCSPVFGLLLNNLLVTNFSNSIINILAYIAGLTLIVGLVAYGGRAAVNKLKRATKPDGRFKRTIATILIIVGIIIFTGTHKTIESRLIENDLYISTAEREYDQLDNLELNN